MSNPLMPPAGWYPDPDARQTRLRYWSGARWTEHRVPAVVPPPPLGGVAPAEVAPVAAPAMAPVVAAAAGAGPAASSATTRTGLRRRAGWVGAGVLGLSAAVVAAALAIGSPTAPVDNESLAVTGGGGTAVPSITTTSAPRATTSAPDRVVPPTTPTVAVPAPTPTTATTRPAVAGILVAVVGVTDGDTLKVSIGGTTERVRVIGIDTPELSGDECFAQKAASRMQSLVQSRQVRLVADPSQGDRDRYDRLLRHVFLADGRSAAGVLIAGGFGREYTYDRPYAGQATYRAAQASAQRSELGVWSAACAGPGAQAAAPRASDDPTPSASPPAAVAPGESGGSCDIKGNIAGDGEKIYHLPGQRYYDATKITPSKGERMFCSEADAVAAGWRAAKV